MDTTAPRSTCCGYSSLLARVAGDREEAWGARPWTTAGGRVATRGQMAR
jgi:hypothetical protein